MPIVVSGNVAPTSYAPTITSPANASYVDLAGEPTVGTTITWTYNPAIPSLTQTGYVLRAKIAGAASYVFWNASISAWQSSQVINSSTVSDCVFPPGAFQDGVTYNISAATRDANGLGQFCADLSVSAQAGPTVTILSPSGATNTALPTVQWAPGLPTSSIPAPLWLASTVYSAGEEVSPATATGFVYRCTTGGTTGATHPTWPTTDGGTVVDGTVHWEATLAFTGSSSVTPQQETYRVVIYSGSQYTASGFAPGDTPSMFDTGQIPSAIVYEVQCTNYLPDSTPYRAYVQITETGGQQSLWSYSSFTTSYTAPQTPTFTVSAAADGNGAPVTDITVQGHEAGGSSLLGLCVANVQFSDDGGTTWYALRNGTGLLPAVGQTATFVDTELASGLTRMYRVILTVES